MGEQKTPLGLERNSRWREVRTDGWQRLVEFVCQVERRQHLSGLPGLYFVTCIDVKDSAQMGSSVPGQWANRNEAITAIINCHNLSASMNVIL